MSSGAPESTQYWIGFTASLIAAASTIAALVPPSIMAVVYGAIGNVSIAGLFLGGVVPGFMIAIGLMIYSYLTNSYFFRGSFWRAGAGIERRSMSQSQVWKNSPFTIERITGKNVGTVIFRLCGPFTARDMYGTLTPDQLSSMLASQPAPGQDAPRTTILDLTEVPYIDSSGLGMLVKHFVSCKNRGIRWMAAGANARILELLKLTRMEAVLPTCATVEEAELSGTAKSL